MLLHKNIWSLKMKAKNCQKMGKGGENWGKKEKLVKKQGKNEKSGRKGKNLEGSFTLPLVTDGVGYPTFKNTTDHLQEVLCHKANMATQGLRPELTKQGACMCSNSFF